MNSVLTEGVSTPINIIVQRKLQSQNTSSKQGKKYVYSMTEE